MLNLPKGVWKWIDANARDLGRIASALETIAREAVEIRKALQDGRGERGERKG